MNNMNEVHLIGYKHKLHNASFNHVRKAWLKKELKTCKTVDRSEVNSQENQKTFPLETVPS